MGNADLNINPDCASFEDLFSGLTGSTQYGHLRIILSKNNNHEFGQHYLYVSQSAFGKVKLCNLDFIDNHIYILSYRIAAMDCLFIIQLTLLTRSLNFY
jgi:hypothetical protein